MGNRTITLDINKINKHCCRLEYPNNILGDLITYLDYEFGKERVCDFIFDRQLTHIEYEQLKAGDLCYIIPNSKISKLVLENLHCDLNTCMLTIGEFSYNPSLILPYLYKELILKNIKDKCTVRFKTDTQQSSVHLSRSDLWFGFKHLTKILKYIDEENNIYYYNFEDILNNNWVSCYEFAYTLIPCGPVIANLLYQDTPIINVSVNNEVHTYDVTSFLKIKPK